MINSASHPQDPGSTSSRPSAVVAKWGPAADAGFQLIPDVLLKNQSNLRLTALELVVLLNLTMHWWYPAQKPFPRSTTIAERMGVDVRTVQRALKQLAELGLIQRVAVQTDTGEGTVIDLDGLVNQLSKLAVRDPAFRRRSDPTTNVSPRPAGRSANNDRG
jgi:hypothetical protein